MMDLRELYQEVIVDHSKRPRNHHDMANPTHHANGYNPLCGDKLTVFVHLENDVVQDVSFVGCGCAISQASASLMTEAVKGLTLDAAHALFSRFHDMLTQETDVKDLDKLTVLAGVRAFPARVKCATLAWHTLEAALRQDSKTIVTE